MARTQTRYSCQSCGAVHGKWSGRCDDCGAWNSIIEEAALEGPGRAARARGKKLDFVALEGSSAPPPRIQSGLDEFDRVIGGGLVPGSAVLLGGDPGVGKSTLLLQVMAALAKEPAEAESFLYISGEESIEQVRMRARRMGISEAPVSLATATSTADIVASIDRQPAARVVVIDSVQTLHLDTLDSAPGTVAQVRTSAQFLTRIAKARGCAIILVGHVTKEGLIAGPKVLEHMVDCVLSFEGDRGHQFRVLRASKNRFGPTDEIGVFEMTGLGLAQVPNPSALFLAERGEEAPGSAVFAGLEGSRPLLVEIQALVSPSPLATPRRAVVGWDSSRLAMILAVLEARCGIAFAGHEVYLNVAGGLRISEPAADLAVAVALLSALEQSIVPSDCVIFGEIGLSGEVRGVANSSARLKEAAKLGFTRALLPRRSGGKKAEPTPGISSDSIGHVKELASWFSAPYVERRRPISGISV